MKFLGLSIKKIFLARSKYYEIRKSKHYASIKHLRKKYKSSDLLESNLEIYDSNFNFLLKNSIFFKYFLNIIINFNNHIYKKRINSESWLLSSFLLESSIILEIKYEMNNIMIELIEPSNLKYQHFIKNEYTIYCKSMDIQDYESSILCKLFLQVKRIIIKIN